MAPKLFIATKAIISHKGKVLLLREAGSYQDGTNIGRYVEPGGRLEPGERFDEALKREVMEETGLTIEIGEPITVSEWRPVVRGEAWQIVGIFFECQAMTDTVTLSSDHDEYVWIDPKEYASYPMPDNLKVIFEKLNQVK